MVVEWHFSLQAAHELQHLDLDDCRADYTRRRAEGQGNGAIISAWRVAPPPASGGGWSTIAAADDAAGDLATPDEGSCTPAPDDNDSWTLPTTAAARRAALLAHMRQEEL